MSYKLQKISEPLLLGEGPHWDDRQQVLFFIDIHGKSIHKYDPATGKHNQTTLDGRPGFMIPVDGTTDQFVAGVERKILIIRWDGEDGSKVQILKELAEIDQHEPLNRLNDGKADPRGRLFAGTMGIQESPGVFQKEKGTLYRVEKAGSSVKIEPVAEKVGISNGLAWDLKEKAFYYTDSLELKVRRYDYDVETGKISNPTFVFDLRKNNIDEGMPDGTTIDTDGNLWLAVFNNSCVLQVDPRTGKVLQKIPIPAKKVASLTFGGPNHDILFVTTGCANPDGPQPPPAGSTFMITGLGVKGHPNVSFKY